MPRDPGNEPTNLDDSMFYGMSDSVYTKKNLFVDGTISGRTITGQTFKEATIETVVASHNTTLNAVTATLGTTALSGATAASAKVKVAARLDATSVYTPTSTIGAHTASGDAIHASTSSFRARTNAAAVTTSGDTIHASTSSLRGQTNAAIVAVSGKTKIAARLDATSVYTPTASLGATTITGAASTDKSVKFTSSSGYIQLPLYATISGLTLDGVIARMGGDTVGISGIVAYSAKVSKWVALKNS